MIKQNKHKFKDTLYSKRKTKEIMKNGSGLCINVKFGFRKSGYEQKNPYNSKSRSQSSKRLINNQISLVQRDLIRQLQVSYIAFVYLNKIKFPDAKFPDAVDPQTDQ